MKRLATPIIDADLYDLNVGDQVSISGTVYTGRDAALPKLVELIEKQEVPFNLNGSIIMHTAVSDAGIAPTTSSKVEIESSIAPLSENGVKIHIGKGMLSKKTCEELDKNNSIFVITPPVAALLTSKVRKKECVLFENEGMEAVYRLEVDDIPGIVAVHNGDTIQPPEENKQDNELLILFAYVSSSVYRTKALQCLRNGIKIPKEIAEETEIIQAHISKVLKELKNKKLIECLNETNKKGRIYCATPLGKEVLKYFD